MQHEEDFEEETEIGKDRGTVPGLDPVGSFDTDDDFNAAIAEVSANVDADDYIDQSWLDDSPEYSDTEFETLPEMDIILHNIDI